MGAGNLSENSAACAPLESMPDEYCIHCLLYCTFILLLCIEYFFVHRVLYLSRGLLAGGGGANG